MFDGLAAEVLLEDGLDFGEAIKPGDNAQAGHAVAEGATDLVADFHRQAPDLSSMTTMIMNGHIHAGQFGRLGEKSLVSG